MKKLLAQARKYVPDMQKLPQRRRVSSRHNPEFTILEWYRINADYTAIMDDCEHLLRFIGQRVGREELTFSGRQYDLAQPWERLSVAEAFERYAGLTLETLLDEAALKQAAQRKGIVGQDTTWEEVYNQIFLNGSRTTPWP